MAVMKPSRPRAEPVVEKIAVEPAHYKGVTVDTEKTPISTLTTYLEGQSWIVDYYSTVVARDTALGGLQVGLNATYQQYKLIRGFEFKVSSPLAPSQNEKNKEMSLVGSANIYSVLIPNEGDMFIADIGDGREGLFQVMATRRKSIYSEAAHEIDYKIISQNDDRSAADLAKKTVETVFFNRDFLREGYKPLLQSETVDVISKLDKHYSKLLTLYFNDFYSREHNTLIVPNQDLVTYDPFLTQFVCNIIGTDEHPSIKQIHLLNVSNDQAMYELTLWNCLEKMDYSMLAMAAQEMGIIPVKNFFSRPMVNSIYYSRVKSVIYPMQCQTNVDAGYQNRSKVTTAPLAQGSSRFRELKRALLNTELEMDTANGPYVSVNGLDAPEIKTVTEDNYYVFTKSFYDYDADVGQLSLLENLTRKALQNQPIDLPVLEKLCSRAMFWNNVERFYYMPILFVLLRVYPRGL